MWDALPERSACSYPAASFRQTTAPPSTIAGFWRATSETAEHHRLSVTHRPRSTAAVGHALRPTERLIFGAPTAGTPLLQADQTIGIGLPRKALVWEDASGVWSLQLIQRAARHALGHDPADVVHAIRRRPSEIRQLRQAVDPATRSSARSLRLAQTREMLPNGPVTNMSKDSRP